MDILQVDSGSIFLLPKLYKIFILYSYRYSLNYLHHFFNPIILLYHDPL